MLMLLLIFSGCVKESGEKDVSIGETGEIASVDIEKEPPVSNDMEKDIKDLNSGEIVDREQGEKGKENSLENSAGEEKEVTIPEKEDKKETNTKSSKKGNHIKVIISKDFGRELISKAYYPVGKDTNVMDILIENYEIETAYGGSFVNSIGGLKSGFTGMKNRVKMDWFYYANGILTQVGAEDYYLQPGDVVIWDYHNWDNSTYLSAIVGAYPANFINGYDGVILGTEIRTSEEFKEEGEAIKEYLQKAGVKDIAHKALTGGHMEDDGINTIVIGEYEDLLKVDYLKGIFDTGKRAGIFVDMESLNDVGVITTVNKGYQSPATLWIVTGKNGEAVKRAAQLLYKEAEKIEGKFSLLVTEEGIIHIP